MNLTEFVNKKIKNGYSQYDYFELGKTNQIEYEKLSGLELQYLKNNYVIYKEKNMDRDYQIHTYIFDESELYLLITNHCDTKETQYKFYKDNYIKKSVWYLFDRKSSHNEYDKNGKEKVRVNYPLSDTDKLNGYKYKNDVKTPMDLIELEKYI